MYVTEKSLKRLLKTAAQVNWHVFRGTANPNYRFTLSSFQTMKDEYLVTFVVLEEPPGEKPRYVREFDTMEAALEALPGLDPECRRLCMAAAALYRMTDRGPESEDFLVTDEEALAIKAESAARHPELTPDPDGTPGLTVRGLDDGSIEATVTDEDLLRLARDPAARLTLVSGNPLAGGPAKVRIEPPKLPVGPYSPYHVTPRLGPEDWPPREPKGNPKRTAPKRKPPKKDGDNDDTE
jgi:hypothetical protein